MDEFPEAFRRFERVVDTDRILTFDQLLVSFRYWAGRNWKGTYKQVEALKGEADRLGIPVYRGTFRAETRPSYTAWYRVEKYGSKTVCRNLINGRFIRKP